MAKMEAWFQTNLDYFTTRAYFGKTRRVIGTHESKGRLTFYLKDHTHVTFQITRKGKLGIWFPEEVDHEDFLQRVKPLLLKDDGTQAEILKVIKKPSVEAEIEKADYRSLQECVDKLTLPRTSTFSIQG